MAIIVQFLIVFKDYLVELLPFLAVGFLLSGVIHEFVPSGWVERHLGGKGIRPLIRKKCDFCLSVPIKGEFESLNASVAGAVVLFEAMRQRQK